MKKRSIERKLLFSILSFVLCCTMLIGMTYAWFTVDVQSGDNVIKVGAFDATVWFHNTYITADAGNAAASDADPEAGEWVPFEGNSIFNDIAFLPGDEVVRYVKYENKCDYPVKFDLVLPKDAVGTFVQAEAADDFDVYTKSEVTGTVTTAGMTKLDDLKTVEDRATAASPALILSRTLAANTKEIIAVAVKLPTTYSDVSASAIIETFKLRVIATQYNVAHEDTTADSSESLVLTADNVTVTIPAANVATNDHFELIVSDVDDETPGTFRCDITLKKNNETITEAASLITVAVKIGTGLTVLSVKHKNVEVTDWVYSNGVITFTTDSFSPFEVQYVVGEYVARIGETYYETLAGAVSALQSGETIVLLKDISLTKRSDRFTFNEKTTFDLNRHTLTVTSYPTLTVNNDLSFKNGVLHSAKAFAPANNVTMTFENMTFEKDVSASAQSFQLYNKANVTINFVDSVISYSGTPSSNVNNLALIGHTGGTNTDNIVANFRNTTFAWTDGVPVITYAANTLTCYATFDQTGYDSIRGLSNAFVSTKGGSPLYLIKKTEENGIYKYRPIVAEYWTDRVTEQPAGYSVNGDAVTVGSAEAFAWFAKQVETNDFAGKTVSLTADIDMSEYIWRPINGRFAGTFDGGDHTISNVFSAEGCAVTSSSILYGNGIFHRVSGTVRNLVISNAVIGTSDNTNIVGVVAGYCENAEFVNVSVVDSQISGFGKVGGIVGMQESGTVTLTNCSVRNIVIEGAYNCAGFIGLAQGTVVSSGCSAQSVVFRPIFSLDYVYIDVTEPGHIGKYWAESDVSTDYYAAWGDVYTDYDDETIDGITYIGKCH